MSNRLYNQFSFSPERQPVSLMGKFTQAVSNVQATLVNQAVTYTAVSRGTAGNAVTIRLINPGTTSSLSIVTTGTAIVVTLAYATGAVTTTATSLVAAINGDVSASALVTASGSGASILAALATTPLAAGVDASITDNAMNMSMTQTATGTYILQLEDEFPEVLSCQVTLLAASAANLAAQVVSTATAFGGAKTITIRTLKMTDQSLTSMAANNAMFVHLILRNSSNP